MKIEFAHRQSAHCESGVTANLLSHQGLEVSEAMAFGLGGGLFFGYFPFVRVNYLPLVTYRTSPGAIFRKTMARLGIRYRSETFRRQDAARTALDQVLDKNIPVGLQTGVYWLPYFPKALRFHFNAHNLVVYGREGEDYLLSDPVFDVPVRCAADDLQRARFAKGALAPRGRMYRLERIPETPDFEGAIGSAIREVTRKMVKAPIPVIGVRGMRYLARQMENWPNKLGQNKAILYLGHLIRMQEEIGTGGGGFRFMYSAFLQESAAITGKPALLEISEQMTEIGDLWRQFAVRGARVCKNRGGKDDTFASLADILRGCSTREEALFKDLHKINA